MSKIILFNKPYGVLSQFTSQEGQETLSKYIDVPDFYAAGRLDKDSEGLLVLTDDGALQDKIASPKHKVTKSYWVQVEGIPDEKALQDLRKGVALKDGVTKPAEVKIIDEPIIWPRVPPVRERQSIPTSWLELKIREGRNRQVRRMTVAVGYPTLRLVRYSVGIWNIDDINSGSYLVLTV
ncbi:MAG: pseudouridine synthase [Gammaproteobacteria bacterium]|nr:pseudouridine synthase [bacterium AH-315-E07]PCH61118.1 MAG: pseudouridine synthase [Gammaproteobacteria bacterium]